MKTVTFDDEAYAILKGLKSSPAESFSDVVKKHFRRGGGIAAAFGGWADMDADEAAQLRRSSVEAFGTTGRRGP